MLRILIKNYSKLSLGKMEGRGTEFHRIGWTVQKNYQLLSVLVYLAITSQISVCMYVGTHPAQGVVHIRGTA